MVAQTDDDLVVLLGPGELAACRASPAEMEAALIRAAEDFGLRWP